MGAVKDFSPASFLLTAAIKRAECINLIIPDVVQYTVADSLSYTRKTAFYLLKLGVKSGDRVALIAANSPFHLWLHTACAWIGAVTVILNPRLGAGEIASMLADSGAIIAFFDKESQSRYQSLVSAQPTPAAAIPTTTCPVFSPANPSAPSSSAHIPATPDTAPHFSAACTYTSAAGSPPRCQALPLPSPKALSAHPEITTEPLPCPAGKVGAILYTSGSSGQPKGVVLTHENLYWGSQNFRHGFQYHPHRDVEAVAAPISHIGGFNGTTLDIFANGGTVVLFANFKPDFVLQNLEKYRVNVMFLVPTMYWLLTQSKLWQAVDLSAWRLPLIGGDSITDDLAQLLFQKGLRPIHVWGMTELSAAGSCVRLKPTSPVTTTIGIPFLYNQLELHQGGAQESSGSSCSSSPPYASLWGEFFVAGLGVTPGYWNLDAKLKSTVEGLWAAPRTAPLATGDVGYVDSNRLLFLTARKHRLITRGGETFSPLEVESALKQLPDMVDVAVVGVLHRLWGEEICGAVVPSGALVKKLELGLSPCASVTSATIFKQVFQVNEHRVLSALFAGATGNVTKWKLPTRLVFLEALPQTTVGKIDYHQIKSIFS